MTMLLNAQKSANISPFSFILPSPCLPIRTVDTDVIVLAVTSAQRLYHHRTVDCIWCSEELPIFTGPRYGQRTVVLLCQCFMPSLVSCFGSRGKRTACGVSNDEVTPAFCALAATPATVDDWLCSLYDCTSSQEFVNGARKQFTQIGRAIVLRHKQYLSRTQSGLLTKPVTVGHRR